MYSTKDRTKIGKVTIDYFNKKDGQYIRLRFTYPKGTRNEIAIGRATEQNVNDAIAKAGQINRDIALDNFDTTLVKYDSNRQSVALGVVTKEKEPTIKELWERYKEQQKHIAARTTQENTWKEIDSMLDDLPKNALLLKNIDTLGNESLKIRALSSVDRYFGSLQAAIRQYKKMQTIQLKKQLPKNNKAVTDWFEPDEVTKILEAFKNDRFKPNNSQYNHSYYYPYAAFCAYTGCRPEEAIALTWNDLHWNKDKTKCQVTINKAYSKGVLKTTKNGILRVIPVSKNLIQILKQWEKDCDISRLNLLFPSVEGGYINIRNYRKRYWKVVLDSLVKQGEIRKYIKPYALRHSFVTNLHYNHAISFAVIAGLIGDSIKTVIDKYTGLKPFDAGEMPNIY